MINRHKMPLLFHGVLFVAFLFGAGRVLVAWIEEEKLSYDTSIEYAFGGLVALFIGFAMYSLCNAIGEYKKLKKRD